MSNDNFIIREDGIYKKIYCMCEEYYEMILPKEIFIKAFEKYIKDTDDLK